MLSDAQLASMQATVETTFNSSCTIGPPGTPTFNPATGQDEITAGAAVYEGPCSAVSVSSDARLVEAGFAEVDLSDYLVRIPASATGVEVGHVVTVTSAGDPEVEGKTLRVKFIPAGGYLTSRRLICEEP